MSLGLEKKGFGTTLPSLTPFSPSLQASRTFIWSLVRAGKNMTYAKNGLFWSLVFTDLLKKLCTILKEYFRSRKWAMSRHIVNQYDASVNPIGIWQITGYFQ